MRTNPEIEQITDYAIQIAKKKEHEYVLVEHLLLSLIRYKPFSNVIVSYGISIKELDDDLNNYLDNIENINNGGSPKKTNAIERVFNRAVTQVIFTGRRYVSTLDIYLSITSETQSHASYFLLKHNVNKNEFSSYWQSHYRESDIELSDIQAKETLEEFCTNLNELARDGKLEPLIGRASEIRDSIGILAKKFKSNVLMVGDPGVGKTAIAEGLAQLIESDNVPDFLKEHEVWSLEISDIVAGSKYRGEFEEKFKKIIKSLEAVEKGILFIDEAHTMAGTGSTSGSSLDFANMLKPALTKGNLKVVASTTWEEYYETFEQDRALMRRFYILNIDEPTVETTTKILRGVSKRLEDYHNVSIDDDAIITTVELSNRYIHDRKNPDKGIDLLDSACAKQRANGNVDARITKQRIYDQVTKLTDIPVERLTNENDELISTLEGKVKSKLYGQDDAVDKVLEQIYVNFSGIGKEGKPIASFLLLGPTGTGKTELAKLLSSNLDMKLLRYDMSEYQEKHTISTLIGAPPGYVGFEDGSLSGGKLISELSKDPYSIILFDEIEKAHPDVSNILLQMLDEGTITSSAGKTVDVTNSIILLTSNLGAQANENNAIGFGQDLEKTGEEDKAVKEFFKPELRNRIDATIKFKKLDDLSIKKVVIKFINELKESLTKKDIKLNITENVIEHLANIGYDSKMGARPISRKIDEILRVPLSKKILFEKLENCSINVICNDDTVHFEIVLHNHSEMMDNIDTIIPESKVNDDGLIVLNQFKPK
ncbi:MAG: AAA domain-containing protein [Candidatus Marinimicrobia bacterium]|jgi:ATP-dependent Clp protease ATP-binding subunit ClpA|nr:AAA domain-containing protein [Candidatus Neomarinimicrobiota bacterium]